MFKGKLNTSIKNERITVAKECIMSEWLTGGGDSITIEDIIRIARDYEGKVYLGTDSFISKDKCVFASAICLHGALGSRGGRYFFRKQIVKKNKFTTIVQRVTREVERTLDIATLLYENNVYDLEIHIDVSPPQSATKTSKFSDMLKGYVQGSGFDCKIKPHAWASTSIADKHSK